MEWYDPCQDTAFGFVEQVETVSAHAEEALAHFLPSDCAFFSKEAKTLQKTLLSSPGGQGFDRRSPRTERCQILFWTNDTQEVVPLSTHCPSTTTRDTRHRSSLPCLGAWKP